MPRSKPEPRAALLLEVRAALAARGCLDCGGRNVVPQEPGQGSSAWIVGCSRCGGTGIDPLVAAIDGILRGRPADGKRATGPASADRA